MDEKEAYSSAIAAEAVGETLGSPPPEAERTARPIPRSAGPQARVADKTAESIGERAGDAYADGTTDEVRERSRTILRHAATGDRSQSGGPVISNRFGQHPLVTVAAFTLGYVAAMLVRRFR